MKALLLVAALSATADAHALDIAYLRIDGPRVTIDLDLAAAGLLLGADPATLTSDVIRARAPELAAQSYARELPTTPAGPCTLGAPTVDFAPPSVRLTAAIACPAGPRTWSFPFVTDARIPTTFQLLVKEVAADRLTVIDKTTGKLALSDAIAAPIIDAPGSPKVAKPSSIGTTTLVLGGVLVVVILGPLGYLMARRRRDD